MRAIRAHLGLGLKRGSGRVESDLGLNRFDPIKSYISHSHSFFPSHLGIVVHNLLVMLIHLIHTLCHCVMWTTGYILALWFSKLQSYTKQVKMEVQGKPKVNIKILVNIKSAVRTQCPWASEPTLVHQHT